MDEIFEYKCPCCGGAIKFDTSVQMMKCPYCDTEFELDTLKDYDEVLKAERPDDMSWDDTEGISWGEDEADNVSVFVCNSCGGEIICENTTAASFCPYCSNPVIMAGRLKGDLRPDHVIPFKLDKKAAIEGLEKHLKGKRLLPKVFKDKNHIEEIKGVYVPFWLFDTEAAGSGVYRGTRVRNWSTSDYIYTETTYYSVRREGQLSFMNVPVDGSSKIDNDLMESIEPFDFSEAVDFNTAYLSGFLADRYDVTSKQSQAEANSRIKRSTEAALASTVIGYTSVIPQSTGVSFSGGKTKYVLYPVWLLNTQWEGKRYYFAMNGQTGKFVGDLPLDKKAYFKWLGIWTAAISLCAFAVQFFINLF